MSVVRPEDLEHVGDGKPPADPYGGLLELCPECKRKRDELKRFNESFRGWVFTGTMLDEHHDPDLSKKGVHLEGPFELVCDKCGGRGVVLTALGKRLVAVVEQFIGDVRPEWLLPASEIPF